MTENFGPELTAAYDALYAEKDYPGECDLVEAAFARYRDQPVRRILDLGCGTGSHAILFAERGYDVTGVDLSPTMLDQARRKAAEAGVEAEWIVGDARTVETGSTFDAVLLMFAVFSYQLTTADARETLATARRHLPTGGTLVFDVWYGPGVLMSPPGSRERVVQTPDGPVRRLADADLDARTHSSRVTYRLLRGDDLLATEVHAVRFFFPLELELLLELEGFRLDAINEFGDLDREPGDETWNVSVVATAV